MAMEAKLLPSQQGWAHNALAYLFGSSVISEKPTTYSGVSYPSEEVVVK
jgi:hypothetical protein